MKQLLVISGKGGTGKTTIASAFIKLSNSHAYADCDVDAPNLHLIVNLNASLETKNYYGLPKASINKDLCIECGKCMQSCRFDAIHFNNSYYVDQFACEGCGVCTLVCKKNAINLLDSVYGNLMLYRSESIFSTATLKMGNGSSGKLVTEVKHQLFNECDNRNLVIIDGSPGIGCPVIASLSGVDIALIVVEPSISGISDMKRIIKTAECFKTKIAICINKYDTNNKNTNSIIEYCTLNNLSFIGKIPYDPIAIIAINEGKSIVDFDCPSGIAVRTIYNNFIRLIK